MVNYKICLIVILVLRLVINGQVTAQVENFTNFSVENGLGQSQVYSLVQDKYGMLWAGTLGGVSRFDSHEFMNFDKSNGLTSTLVYALFSDSKNNIWVGTQEGVQIFDKGKFSEIKLPANVQKRSVTLIREDYAGSIYLLCGQHELVKISNGIAELLPVQLKAGDQVTCIETDKSGILYAVVNNRKVYRLKNKMWELFFSRPDTDMAASNFILFFDHGNVPWLIGNTSIYKFDGKELKFVASVKGKNAYPSAVEADDNGNIWVGTYSGAYKISRDYSILYYGSGNGLTDNGIHDILKDKGGDLWFATDAEGIYRKSSNAFTYYNRESGLKSNLVMGVAKDGKAMWIGTADNGLMKFESGRIEQHRIPSLNPETRKINCLYMDSKSRLWIGTIGGGIWIKKGGDYTELKTQNNITGLSVISVFEDSRGFIWVASPQGLFYSSGNELIRIDSEKNVPFSFLEFGKDSILVGTSSGLTLITGHSPFFTQPFKALERKTIVCLNQTARYLIAGTNDEGIFFRDKISGKITVCNRSNGLMSNNIFSFYLARENEIWAGTGNGVHKVVFNETADNFIVKKIAVMNSAFGPECNMNALTKDSDGKLWIGTIRGLLIYDHGAKVSENMAPYIFLKSVKLFSKEIESADTLLVWRRIPVNLKLRPDNNHLTFDFSAIYLPNPGEIQYRYMLDGADTGFSVLSSNSQVIYSNLGPGKYVFRAIAYSNEGTRSSNELSFSFEIMAHFYQETWFRILAVLSLISTGIMIQYARVRIRQKRLSSISNIRREEQRKIQERTSEDLHDDLGNKITRISVLADVLQNKIGEEDAEKSKLVKQIKENAQALYLGTKDIIWSMTPGNDNLYDLFERIRSFGVHMFEDTPVDFSLEGLKNEFRNITLPLDISRHIMMVMKESLNNILKHAGAGRAKVTLSVSETDQLSISISDNGKGFSTGTRYRGNGLRNIQKRIDTIGGQLTVNSEVPGGTLLEILLKIPPKEG